MAHPRRSVDNHESVVVTEYRIGTKSFQSHSRDGAKKRVQKNNYSDSEAPLGTFTLTAYLPQQDWKEVKVQDTQPTTRSSGYLKYSKVRQYTHDFEKST